MVGSTVFPKANGDVFYAEDANILYVVPGSGLLTSGVWLPSGTNTTILTANANRKALLVYNNGSSTVYMGPTGVASTTGFQLTAGDTYIYKDTEALFGNSAVVGSTNVRYLEVS